MLAAMTALVAAAAEVAHEAAAAAEKKSGGLPQLNVNDFAPQLFWLAVTFIVLYLIMSRVALPRIGEVLDERKDRIQRDLASAERLKGETEKALETYEKSLADARANASSIARQTRESLNAAVERERAAVEAQLAQKLGDAEVRIAATKSKALASVNDIAGETVTAIVGRLAGQTVTTDEVAAALSRK
ncbi:MAG: F0F1 ATP synthase subunit B [Hyphomicrobium sp.]|jgi:F-type H+-transporting ATPase subunit b